MPPRVTPATEIPPLDFKVSSMSLTTWVRGEARTNGVTERLFCCPRSAVAVVAELAAAKLTDDIGGGGWCREGEGSNDVPCG